MPDRGPESAVCGPRLCPLAKPARAEVSVKIRLSTSEVDQDGVCLLQTICLIEAKYCGAEQEKQVPENSEKALDKI